MASDKFSRRCPEGRKLSKGPRLGPNSAKLGGAGPRVGRVGPKLAKCGPKFADVGPKLGGFGKGLAETCNCLPKVGQISKRPKVGPAQIDRSRPSLARCLAGFGPTRPQVGPEFAKSVAEMWCQAWPQGPYLFAAVSVSLGQIGPKVGPNFEQLGRRKGWPATPALLLGWRVGGSGIGQPSALNYPCRFQTTFLGSSGQNSPKSGRCPPGPAQVRPKSARIRPSARDLGRM